MAAIETFRKRTETACSVGALLVYFNQKTLKLKKIFIDILLELEYGVQNTGSDFDLLLNVSKLWILLWAAKKDKCRVTVFGLGIRESIFLFHALLYSFAHRILSY